LAPSSASSSEPRSGGTPHDRSATFARPSLPEDETHDDDLDFARGRGSYDPDRVARFNDDSDGDLEFLDLAQGTGVDA
jgi:hypothetical protein